MKEHKARTRRMREQRWLVDRMTELVGVDFEWPGSRHAMAAAGSDVAADVRSLQANVKKFADISREFARVATKREIMAKRAEAEGHPITARDNYYAAAIFYASAQTPIHEDDDEENVYYDLKKIECYNKFIRNAPHPIERVEIPFEGKSLPGLLHLPEKGVKKMLSVLQFDGMHGFKEMLSPLYGDKLLERGMAVLIIDGPGQGEAIMRKIRCTADNFPRAGKAAVDYMITRPEIDPDRIAVYGTSMGSFWVTQVAAYEHRLKAGVSRLACHEPTLDTIFNKTAPTFKERYMWMAGYDDEDEFDKFAKTLTLKGLGARIKCPFLIVAGGDDDLSPIQHSYALYDEIQAPKKIIVYEGEIHSIHTYSGDIQVIIADWIRDRLEGKRMESESIFVDKTGREIKK